MKKEGLDARVIEKLKLETREPDLDQWIQFVDAVCNPSHEIEIALVGKYVEHHDSYKSIVEAFVHAGAMNDVKVSIRWFQSDNLDTNNIAQALSGVQGILVAPGFGGRGIEGKLSAVQYAREQKIPFFGICLGMQCAVIEYARNVCGLTEANSTEFDETNPHPIIDIMYDQKNIENMGGTMRLGKYNCSVVPNTFAYHAYRTDQVQERHRHRYEVNNEIRSVLSDNGLVFSGLNPERDLVEIVEIPDHPWFVGVQFHPELRSTASHPQALFVAFVKAAKKQAGFK